MGRWLAARLDALGCRVEATTGRDSPNEERLASFSDILVLSIPVHQMEPVMARLGPLTKPDGLVIDLCSLKQDPLNSMMRHARGQVLGCHPLFGPSAESLKDQIVFLCEGRQGPWCGRVRAFLVSQGARLHDTTPEDHDMLMAASQSLRHILMSGFGAAMEAAGQDLAAVKPLAGPWFGRLAKVLRQQCTQPPELFADLALGNPEAVELVGRLRLAIDAMDDALADGNREALLEAMRPAWRLTEK